MSKADTGFVPPLPGKRRNSRRVEEMVRVDHAGEYGAVAIYQGQRAIFKGLPHKARIARQLEEMEADEQHHLDTFDRLIFERGTRPTALAPIWDVAGHALGAATALMGEKAAHACTEAVESVIEKHYAGQIEELHAMGEAELAALFTKFREEELEHRDLAIEEGARQAPGYALLSKAIEAGCRVAIKVSERI
ncbi:demethoxyubiquinone hydroxylase family protein [Maricaulis sp.]|jgi:3-demethoxyubiquinol 3-hydroxylase|uniref:demethoxyubiquinone hydroxylase family protein n=1 Tax=Maricaulis sp. TaxID=1486257 RepID=UPI0025FDAA3A|nr:demethoxyubiquinone hydroxylase family protein [Maricaulis sp.]MDF1770106.1 demethoxyubiquinone hydroxylase family protein [Maricaulis sp.]